MGLAGIEREGVESDDLLASEAVTLARGGHEVLIVSSDKDFAQIVDDRIQIMLPPPTANPKLGLAPAGRRGRRRRSSGFRPVHIADYLALVGDASDNIPGVAGVGPEDRGEVARGVRRPRGRHRPRPPSSSPSGSAPRSPQAPTGSGGTSS